MPKYELQAPDGQVVIIEAVDEQTAIAGAKEWYASVQSTKGAKPKAPIMNEQTQEALAVDDPRSVTYGALYQSGRIDPNAPKGSVKNPRVQFDDEAPDAGEFYINKRGQLVQANGQGADIAMSYGTGLYEGLQGIVDPPSMEDLVRRFTGAPPREDKSFSPADVFQSVANASMGVGQRLGENMVGSEDRSGSEAMLAAARENTPQGRQSALGLDYEPQSQLGRYARTAGQMTPNAAVPVSGGAGVLGAVAPRVANVLAPTVGMEVGGALAKASGANQTQEELARMAGGAVGGVLAGVRPVPRAPAGTRNVPLDQMQRIAPQDPVLLRQQAEAYRAAGIDPTLVDVVDEAGRSVARGTASRMTPAREDAVNFRDTRALNLPDRISRQAQRLSDDPRTPDQIRADLTARRAAQGDEQFNAVRNEEVPLAPDTVMALRSPQGRAAINAAGQNALNSLDPEVRAVGARLNTLAGDALDNPGGTTVTVGMAQEISKGLLDAAEAAQRAGNNNQARLLGDLGRAVRDNARQTVPGYDEALTNWAAESRLIEATDIGEGLMKPDTDGFVGKVQEMAPDELEMARAAGRRAIERSVGENPSAAPGVARKIATATEQQARTRALAGDDAAAFETGVAMEERALRNANDISPRTGSQTQLRQQDAAEIGGAVSEAIGTGRDIVRLNVPGLIERGVNWWASRGFNKQQAEEFTRLAIDPAQTDDAIRYIEQKYGVQAARQFLEFKMIELPNGGRIPAGSIGAATGSRPTEQRRQLLPEQ